MYQIWGPELSYRLQGFIAGVDCGLNFFFDNPKMDFVNSLMNNKVGTNIITLGPQARPLRAVNGKLQASFENRSLETPSAIALEASGSGVQDLN